MLLKHKEGHWCTCTIVNYDVLVLIHNKSHQFPCQECWSIHIIHKLPVAIPDHVFCQLEITYLIVFNPDSPPVLTYINPTMLPSTIPHWHLLMLQLIYSNKSHSVGWKLQFFSFFYCFSYRHESGGCCSFLPFTHFCRFHKNHLGITQFLNYGEVGNDIWIDNL